MKKITLIGLLLFTALVSCDSESTEEEIPMFNLSGTIFNDVEMVYLSQMVNGEMMVTDSALIKNRHFKFGKKDIVPQLIHLSFDDSKEMTLFADNSEIEVDVKGFEKHLITVTGPEININWDDILLRIQLKNVVLDSLTTEYYSANDANDQLKVEELIGEYNAADSLKTELIDNFIADNSDSYIVPYLISKFKLGMSTKEELEELKVNLNESVYDSPYLYQIDKRIEVLTRSEKGEKIIDFSQEDKDGNMINISDLRGNYVLIDFWASWCGPCRSENPNVVKAYQMYKSKGFTVLGVSLDTDREKWLEAIKDDHLDWQHVSDLEGWKNAVAEEFGVKSIPFSILIDPEGVILGKNLRDEELQTFLADLFEEK